MSADPTLESVEAIVAKWQAKLADLPPKPVFVEPTAPAVPKVAIFDRRIPSFIETSHIWAPYIPQVFKVPQVISRVRWGDNVLSRLAGSRYGLKLLEPSYAWISTLSYLDSMVASSSRIEAGPDLSRFPHTCPRCRKPAYIGFANIECSDTMCAL